MDTRFVEPSRDDIQVALNHLKENSKSQRKETIQELIDLANETSDVNTVIGAILFHLQRIALSYSSFRSPTNSHLYNELPLKVLGIADIQKISAKKMLVYLHHYYSYLSKKQVEAGIKFPKALEQYPSVIDKVLSETKDLKSALIKRPDLDHLKKNLLTLPQSYRGTYSQRLWTTTSIDHIKLASFIDFLATPEAEAVLLKLSNGKSPKDPAFLQYQYTVYYGTLLHTMLVIEHEYTFTPTSALYNFCKQTLNIDSTSDVDPTVMLNCFSDLRRFQRVVISDTQSVSKLNEYVIREAGVFSNKLLFKDAVSYIGKMSNSIEDLILSETFLWKCARATLNYVHLTVVGIGCFELATAGYGLGLGKGVLVNLASKLGELMIRGPWGAYIGGAIGTKYEKDMVVGMLTSMLVFTYKYLHNWVLGGKDLSLDNIKNADDFRAELKAEIHIEKKYEQEAKIFESDNEWYRALASLPSNRLSTAVRTRIQKALLEMPESKDEIVDDEMVLVRKLR